VLSAVTIYFRPGLLIHKRASKIATATLYASILNIAMNIVLLPRVGLIGAAVATMVSYAGIVIFLAYESMKVLPFKLELVAFARYAITGVAVAWLATQIQIESPLLSAVAKASFTVVLYTGVLCIIDARVRKLVSKAGTMASAWIREPRTAVLETMPSVAEKKMAVNQ
jgi:O-antigen/teichoic acid export membrane protein